MNTSIAKAMNFNRLGVLVSIAVALGTGLLLFAVWAFQDHLLYHPTPAQPSAAGTAKPFSINGQTLQGTIVNSGQQTALLYFGGNGETLELSARDFTRFPQITSYLVNYRGYGGSSGKPSQEALYADALTIYDQLKPHHTALAVFGRSLGSAVACYLASQRPVSAVILSTPFDSIEQVAQEVYPWLPISLIIRDRFPSFSFAPAIKAPVTILYAGQDELVRNPRTEALIRSFSNPPRVLRIAEADHNNISRFPQYWQTAGEALR